MMILLQQVLAAFLGTIAFSLLFGVPRKYYIYCGLVGAVGWLVYSLYFMGFPGSVTVATFLATVCVILLSRFFAVWEHCPVTVFLTTGIFPLVPGAGIYWTSYYLVTNQTDKAQVSGFLAIKMAIAIVLAIVLVFEIPHKFFNLRKK